tara:strand:+ start:3035 stop:3409 length:375 start_codon:yes stop_codon:yes gene_type:complete
MKEDIDILFKNWRNIPIVSSQLFMQDFPYLTSPWDHWNKVVDVLKNSQDSPIHIDENDDKHNENDDNHNENDDHHKENDDHHKENDENDENVDNKSDSSEEKENQKENQKNNQNVDWVQSDDEL